VEARYGSFSKRHMSPSASVMRVLNRGNEVAVLESVESVIT
jgi:hypothetical protein